MGGATGALDRGGVIRGFARVNEEQGSLRWVIAKALSHCLRRLYGAVPRQSARCRSSRAWVGLAVEVLGRGASFGFVEEYERAARILDSHMACILPPFLPGPRNVATTQTESITGACASARAPRCSL